MKNVSHYLRNCLNQLGKNYGSSLCGRDLIKTYSSLMDTCIRKIFLSSIHKRESTNNNYAIAALGGYGREELSPYSDIDLMFLMPERCNGTMEGNIREILYPLWDAGLVVGHCKRTIKDCVTLLKNDMKTRTSLMEMRYLAGDENLYRKFEHSILRSAFSKGVTSFISDILKDMQLRHTYYGDSAYLLEPHLKEGEGGLRDIQSALWIAKVRAGVRALGELEEKGVLSSSEISLLEKSLEFYWKVRNGLHFLSGRKNDHLCFEYQEKIAQILGYGDFNVKDNTRYFMHDYYQSAENIKYLTSVIIERSRENKGKGERIGKKAFTELCDDGFTIQNNRISIVDLDLFNKNPCALMKVFRFSQELNKEVSIDTQELIKKHLDEIDEGFKNSPEVNMLFLSILKRKKGVTKVLKTMHRLGFLDTFIPEFAHITHLPQSPCYHVYTVDIHTLFAVEQFEKLILGNYKYTFPFLSNLVREEKRAELIFLALLLHDLGKAFETNHVEEGVQLVHKIAHRMGLSEEDTHVISFLVENHISMARVAQTRDLSDEHLIIKFARKMKDIDRLRMLYILTFADLKATRAEVFNTWKDALFQKLYLRTLHVLEKGDFTRTDVASKLETREDEVITALYPKIPLADIKRNLELTPTRYLLNTTSEILSDHIMLCSELSEIPLAFKVKEKSEKGYYDILIATSDFHGLFSLICSVMVYHNMNIVEAQIDTRSDGIAFELLCVHSLYDNKVVDWQEWEEIKDDMIKVIDGRIKGEELVKKRESYLQQNRKRFKDIQTSIRIDNDISDFFTVIDIETSDRFGLLYSITKALTSRGIYIYRAKIATHLAHVTDSFYVRDIFGQKIYDENTLSNIRATLFEILHEPGGLYEKS